MKPKCTDEQNVHHSDQNNLVEITRNMVDAVCKVEEVVRWCKLCGAVAVDNEVDGRLMGSFVKMKFPSILKGNSNENVQGVKS